MEIKFQCHYGCRYVEGIVATVEEAKEKRDYLRSITPDYDRFIFKAYDPKKVKFDRWGDMIEGAITLD